MKTLKYIKGINELIQALPSAYRSFLLFGNIIKLEYEKVFDQEKCQEIYNLNLILTDDGEHYKIKMLCKNVHGEISFSISESISGLSICDMKDCGYENDTRFRVYDFETSDFSIYCENIEVSLLQG